MSFKALLQQAEIGKSRSSVINSLQWTIVILLTGTLAVMAHGPSWLLIFLAGLLGLVVVFLCLAYAYFAAKNPDALRSEKYALVKAALEKQQFGDSLSGLHEVINKFDDSSNRSLVPPSNAKRIDSERQ